METFNNLLYLNDVGKVVLEQLYTESVFFENLPPDCVYSKQEFSKIRSIIEKSFPDCALPEGTKNLQMFLASVSDLENFLKPHLEILEKTVSFIKTATSTLKQIVNDDTCLKLYSSNCTIEVNGLILNLIASCAKILIYRNIIPCKLILGFIHIIYDKRGQEFGQYKLLTSILGNDGLDFFRKAFNTKGICFSYLISPFLVTTYNSYDYVYKDNNITKLDVDASMSVTKPSSSTATLSLLYTPTLHEKIFFTLLVCPSLITKDNLILLEKGFNDISNLCLSGSNSTSIYDEYNYMIDNYAFPDDTKMDVYSVLKDMIRDKGRTCQASSSKIHIDHRDALISLLPRYTLLLEDSPTLAGPQLFNILKVMMLAKAEIEWYMYNCKKVSTSNDLITSLGLGKLKGFFSQKKTIEVPDLSDESFMKLIKVYMELKRKVIHCSKYIHTYLIEYFKTTIKELLDIYVKSSTSQGLLICVAQKLLTVCDSLPPLDDPFYTNIQLDIDRAFYVDNTQNCVQLSKLLQQISIYLYFVQSVESGMQHYCTIDGLYLFVDYICSAFDTYYMKTKQYVAVDFYLTTIDIYAMVLTNPIVQRQKELVQSYKERCEYVLHMALQKYVEFIYYHDDNLTNLNSNFSVFFEQITHLLPNNQQFEPLLSIYSDVLNDYNDEIVIFDTTYNISLLLYDTLYNMILNKLKSIFTQKVKNKDIITLPSFVFQELNQQISVLARIQFYIPIDIQRMITDLFNNLFVISSVPLGSIINRNTPISSCALPPFPQIYINHIMTLLKTVINNPKDYCYIPSLYTFVTKDQNSEFELYLNPSQLQSLVVLLGPTGCKVLDIYILTEIDKYIKTIKEILISISAFLGSFKTNYNYIITSNDTSVYVPQFTNITNTMTILGIYTCFRKSLLHTIYIYKHEELPMLCNPLSEVCSRLWNEQVFVQPKPGKFLLYSEDLHVYEPVSYLSEAFIVNFKFSAEHKGDIWNLLPEALTLSFILSNTFADLHYDTLRSLLTPHIHEIIAAYVMLVTTFIGPSQDILHAFLTNFLSLATKTFLLVKTDVTKSFKNFHYNELIIVLYQLMNEFIPLCNINPGTFPPCLPYILIRQAYGCLNDTDVGGKVTMDDSDAEDNPFV